MTEETGIFQQVFFLTHKKLTFFLLAIYLGPVKTADAISSLNIAIESVKNNTATVSNSSIVLSQGTANKKLSVSAGKLNIHSQDYLDFKSLKYDCDNLILKSQAIHCDNGRLSASNPSVSAKNSPVTFSFNPATNHAALKISDLKLFSGKASGQITFKDKQLNSSFDIKRINLSTDSLSSVYRQNPEEKIDFNSLLSGQIRIELINDNVNAGFDLAVDGLSFSNQSGEILGEGITSHLKGDMRQTASGYAFKTLSVSLNQGELLTPYFYSNFKQRPLDLSAKKAQLNENGNWHAQVARINEPYFQIEANKLTGQKTQIEDGSVFLNKTDLKNIYSYYFKPVITKELAQLTVEGEVSGHFSLRHRAIDNYNLKLADINLEHVPVSGNKKYLFKNLNAHLNSAAKTENDSYLAFENASLFETIEFGATHIPLHTSHQSISTAGSSELSVFDGKLIIEKFSLDISDDLPKVDFEGFLTPVSLSMITRALGWPIMQGKISGIIPAVRYQQRNAKLDGTLLIRVFDGNVLLKDVQASHLLSPWPVLKADLEFKKIDLEQLTQTFEFGRITGNIDGQINNLVLENWRPSQFDANFKTSADSGRKRISQKAVDNISNLGGAGVAGALSRSFMRIFEDFGYDELGFSCKLRNSVCQMDGVGKANQGYYLVKGGGLPRIDVIGHNRQTDWDILVDRLVSITDTGTPTIK